DAGARPARQGRDLQRADRRRRGDGRDRGLGRRLARGCTAHRRGVVGAMSGWSSSSVVIRHDVGLHARPSVKLTKLAKSFASAIEISGSPEGPWVDAKSIVKVMAMKAKQDSTLYMRARGGDATAAVEALRGLVESDFDEDRADAASA